MRARKTKASSKGSDRHITWSDSDLEKFIAFQVANKKYDRIFILSDMQGREGYNTPTSDLAEYSRRTNCKPFIYSMDLAGYGTLQFPENKVFCIAGFSERIFDIVKILEQDKEALIKEIEKIEL
jgi:60 kDa SS-A/Ro ribonucleoprotein